LKYRDQLIDLLRCVIEHGTGRGARRLCRRQAAGETPERTADSSPAAAGGSGEQCNIPVCERFYSSFRTSDCTYQPYWGAAATLRPLSSPDAAQPPGG